MKLSCSSTIHTNQHKNEYCARLSSNDDLPSDVLVTNRLDRSSNSMQQLHLSSTNQNIANDDGEMLHETYLSLTRKDINEVINALQTLVDCIHNFDTNDKSPTASTCQTKFHYYRGNKSKFLDSGTQQPNHRRNAIRKDSGDNQQMNNFTFDIPTSFLHNHQKQSNSSVKIVPRRANTFQALQGESNADIMSADSLTVNKQICQGSIAHVNESSKVHHRSESIGVDIATQWSIQNSNSKSEQSMTKLTVDSNQSRKENDNSIVPLAMKTSPILTEISQSLTTIRQNRPIIPCDSNRADSEKLCYKTSKSECRLSTNETEQLLQTLDLPMCQCIPLKPSSINQSIINLSLDNLSKDKRKRKQRIKGCKRKTRTCIKPTKQCHHVQSKLADRTDRLYESSSLDLFDMDSTLFDTHDRFFVDA